MRYRDLGRTGARLSVIGFGGMLVRGETQVEADRRVASAVERGVNYFDVSPTYGDAEQRLGPALRPHRQGVFLACKTRHRDVAAAEEGLNSSLRTLQTDHFDLFQLHMVANAEEMEQIFAPKGALEMLLRARDQGKTRFIGFSAHSAEVAVEMLRRFPFDTVLCPLNFCCYLNGGFGPQVVDATQKAGAGLLAIKSLALTAWPEGTKRDETGWTKCWYQPIEDPSTAALAFRFTLSLPVTAALTPGHQALWEIALREAEEPRPLDEDEMGRLRELAARTQPLFKA